MGSYLLENLKDAFPHKLIQTYSVFPNMIDNSDVVTQPYNSVLTLSRLTEFADSTIVLDNSALYNIVRSSTSTMESIPINHVNSLVSNVLSTSTAALRYPGYGNSDLISLISELVPSPRLHYLMTAYTPLSETITVNATHSTASNSTPSALPDLPHPSSTPTSMASAVAGMVVQTTTAVRKTSVYDVQRRLLQGKNLMASANTHRGCYLSAVHIIQGEVDPAEVHSSLQRLGDQGQLRFIPWGPNSIQVLLARRSPYLPAISKVNGLMIANHSSVQDVCIN